jgi:hypothetical protein
MPASVEFDTTVTAAGNDTETTSLASGQAQLGWRYLGLPPNTVARSCRERRRHFKRSAFR